MPDERYVDIAPVPADHEPGPLCWCEPVRSIRIDGGRLLVHRTDVAGPMRPPPAGSHARPREDQPR